MSGSRMVRPPGRRIPAIFSREKREMDLARKHLARVAILAGALGLSVLGAGPAGAELPINIVAFAQTNLVSNVPGVAPVIDPALIDPRGMAFFGVGFFWMADAGNGTASLYGGGGQTFPITPVIPGAASAPAGSKSRPSGVVANLEGPFDESFNGQLLPSNFIFVTEDGVIDAWNQAEFGTAVLAVDNSASGALYKGVAIAQANTTTFTDQSGNTTPAFTSIYATNFRAGTVDAFSSSFDPVTTTGGFVDTQIPSGFAPFGIREINGELWVTYALQDSAKTTDVPGVGNGFIDVFDGDGNLLRRFAAHTGLNSPWDIARAPFGFGQFAGDILVANHGDGTISVFDNFGAFLGQLRTADGRVLTIPGLWGISPGGALFSTAEDVYFSAGPNNGADGLFGFVSAVPLTPPAIP
jgi:uncharacterized protein (TIGR03118 family)